jgi:hypothetical protein
MIPFMSSLHEVKQMIREEWRLLEELSASIIRVTRIVEPGTTLAITSN